MKTSLFGAKTGQGVIDNLNTNIGLNDINVANRIFTAEGDITTATVSSESWIDGF